MDTDKLRKRKMIRATGIVILVGMLYYCFVKVTGIGIPCFFHLVTGLRCPGCGISTMFVKLAEGDPAAAFRANRFLFATSPFLLFELAYSYRLSWTGKKQTGWNECLLIAYTVLLVLFGILRNLPAFQW